MRNTYASYALSLLLFICFTHTHAQPLSKLWDKRFGGAGSDELPSMIATSDGGFLLGGYSESGATGDKSQASQGSYDYWVVKIDGSGTKLWDKSFGGAGDDYIFSMIATTDGGFLLGGYSFSGAEGDKSQASQGESDYWVVKIDGSGTKLWDKRFGGTGNDGLDSMIATSDGGFLLGGYSESGATGDKSQASHGGYDYWVVKIDGSGTKLWDKRFGGAGDDALYSMLATTDGGFLLGGYSRSGVSGDKTQASQGSNDYWVVKIDGNGTKLWDKRFGGADRDVVTSMLATFDGGFLLGGYSVSGAEGDKSEASRGNQDYWVVKIDGSGTKLWDKRFGGAGDDALYSMLATSDGGFLLGGESGSGAEGDKSEASRGNQDYWVVKIDGSGTKLWDKRFGGAGSDYLYSMIAIPNNGFLLSGSSTSGAGGDKSQGLQGSLDYWVVKIGECSFSASITPSTPQSVCSGATLALSGSSTGGSSPTYSWSAGGGAFESNQQNPSFTAPTVGSATSYTVTLTTSENGCSATATVQVSVNALTVMVGTITQPNCATATGSVDLSGLPATGTWTLTRSPDAVTTTGTGTTTTISSLAPGTYTFTVSDAAGCTSSASANVVINTQPPTPATPTVGTITQPTCSTATGRVVLSGLPSGGWTINPGNITGTATSRTITSLTANTYNFTVTNSVGCVSVATANVVINPQPATPTLTAGTAINPTTCGGADGSIAFTSTNLPDGTYGLNFFGFSINSTNATSSPQNVSVVNNAFTLSGLKAGYYFQFSITNNGCTGRDNTSRKILTSPVTPNTPTVPTVEITQPTCATATGSVVLSGLPTSGFWTIATITNSGVTSSTDMGATTTLTNLLPGTYNFTVTNNLGCTSAVTADVVINPQPATPAMPTVGTISQPTCATATGSVELSGLPVGTWTINPGNISGTGSTTTIMDLVANTYNFTVTNSVGCVSVATANVVINPQPAKPTAVITNATICSGESYTWSANNQVYTTAQTGLTITNDGCTANQVLNLTVTSKPTAIITTASICSGESYTWSANNQVYTTAQTGLTITNDDCTANQVLNLTVTSKPTAIITNATICSGESYTWSANNQVYNTPQSNLTITNNGCTADQVLNLTVTSKPTAIITTASICSGESYTWSANNQVYSTPQSNLTITNDGCTANQVLNLSVTSKPTAIITTASICSGKSYTWSANNQVYSTPQSNLTIPNDGCTADQVLNLSVTAKPTAIITTASICSGESYTWSANNQVYTTAQTGLTITNDGCTANQVLNLTVTSKPTAIITTASICSGESYTWSANNQVYSTPQSNLTITNDGCTANQVLNLTVTSKPTAIITTASICSGESYTWSANNQVYSTPQSNLTITNDGCTANQVLNLTVTSKPTAVITNATICSGESYTWSANNQVYTTAQTGLTITNDGCTANQVLNLTVTSKPTAIITTASICSGESYTWSANNQVYTTTQTGLTITNDGCTANQVLNLSVTAKPTAIITTASICSGESYTWSANNQVYTTAQTGLTITNDGCTANQVLNLTVTSKPTAIITTASICSGESYTWSANNQVYTTAQTGLTITNDGCTADQVLNLTVTSKPTAIITTASICSGESYTWSANNQVYTTAQTGLTITNDGCTANQVLNLTVTSKPTAIITTASICSGESYTWSANNQVYSTPQSNLTITNDGCTANQVLNLSVTAKPTAIITNVTICSGESYTWSANNQVYTTTQTGLTITNDGCTANQVLNLTVTSKPTAIITTASICSGESYTWSANNQVYSTPQSNLTITNNGCTADQVLNLTVTSKPTAIITTASICSGESYTWSANNQVYSTPQSNLTITNDGCTANQVLNLSVTSKPTAIITTASICSGKSYTWSANNQVYSTPQSNLTIPNDGCTADQVLNLSVTAKPTAIITTASICSGESYTWSANNQVYTTAQTGLTITNDGCTANQVLNLTVTSKPTAIITTASICSGESYTWSANNQVYSTPQSNLTITNDGCTANQVLNLTVTSKPTAIITTASICSGESYTWSANNQVYSTPQSNLTITNDGCTANQVLNLTVTSKPTAVITNATICSGESYTWSANNQVYTTAQTGLTITNDGCTADQVLNLTVTAKPTAVITTASICSGESYTWSANNQVYTTTQTGLTITNDGCTANQVLNLTVTSKPTAIITTASICSGESYTWSANNQVYSTPQSNLTITNNGCTADQVLNLTVTSKPTAIITTASICSGESYTWSANNQVYSTPQSNLTITNDGCTANQVLNLTVTSKPTAIITTASICSGESYTWSANNQVYSTPQSNLTITNDGCTADQVLNLSVTAKPTAVITTASICSGESYTWSVNNQVYSTPQSNLTITNNGCTADQVLNLSVTAKPTAIITTASICSGESYTWSANNQVYTTAQTGLTITNDGCTADQVLNLTVTAKPTTGIDLSSPSICTGGMINLTATGSSSYSWASSGGTFSSSTSSPTSWSTNNAGGYTISVTAGSGTCTATATASVTVNNSLSPLLSFAPICTLGNPLNLSASGGSSYSWRGPNGFKSNIATPSKAKTVAKDEGIYSVTVTGVGGCTATSTIRVYIGVGKITATSNSTVCKGGTIQLSATAEFGASYKWTKQFSSVVYNVQNPSIPNAQPSNGGVYIVFVTGVNGCIGKQETLVVVSSAPCTSGRLASGEEVEEMELEVNTYPNPTSKLLTVEVKLAKPSSLNLQLFNATGNTLTEWNLPEESTIHRQEIDLSEYKDGLYLIQAQSKDGKQTKRVMKIE